MKTFFIVLTATFLAGDLFVWWRGARLLKQCHASKGARLFYHLFLAAQTFLLAGTLIARSNGLFLDEYLPSVVMMALFIWHPFIMPVLLLLYLLGWLQSGIARVFRKPPPEPPSNTPSESLEPALSDAEAAAQAQSDEAQETLKLSRRQFLGTAAALTPPLLTLFLTGVAARQLTTFRVREITLFLPQLPEALDGTRIVHLSDTHVGRFTHGAVLQKIAETTNALNPDFVVLTGDLVNDSLEWFPQAEAMLRAIKHPVYFCEGNHDLIHHKRQFWEAIRKVPNVHFLSQEGIIVPFRGEKVQILGSAWDRQNSPRLTEELEAMRDPEAFTFFLVHHPHSWDHPHAFDVTFAGHTHGGQLMASKNVGFGPKMYRYWSGLYERLSEKGKQALIVSNGVGNWFPLRVNAPAEIILVTLRRGKDHSFEKRPYET